MRNTTRITSLSNAYLVLTSIQTLASFGTLSFPRKSIVEARHASRKIWYPFCVPRIILNALLIAMYGPTRTMKAMLTRKAGLLKRAPPVQAFRFDLRRVGAIEQCER